MPRTFSIHPVWVLTQTLVLAETSHTTHVLCCVPAHVQANAVRHQRQRIAQDLWRDATQDAPVNNFGGTSVFG